MIAYAIIISLNLFMLICNNITVNIKDRPLIKNLGFSLFDNTLMVIKGKNGCGKSTLLKIIAGFIKPANGEILWQGINIAEDYPLYQGTEIAYLGHNNALKPFLTVKENLHFYASLKNTAEMIEAATFQFGISEYLNVPIYKLSEGMQKKVALARMMICNAKLWLLDEPDNNLDDFGKEMLAKLIDIRTKEGGTVIMTSHSNLNLPYTAILHLEDFTNFNE